MNPIKSTFSFSAIAVVSITVVSIAVVSFGFTQNVTAKSIKVQFDVSDVIQVHELPTPEWAKKEQVRLVEARFEISSLIIQGDDQQLVHFIYRIESPRHSVKVVDYLPRTQLSSPIVGPVTIDKSDEKGSRIGGSATTRTGTTVDVLAKVDASHQNSNRSSVRYELLPPQKLIAASGTINRQYGVYFKLKPSTLTSLEGGKEFVCIFQVPKNWKADYLTVHCEARAHHKDSLEVSHSEKIITQQKFHVGLYQAGEKNGRTTAAQVVKSIGNLQRATQQYRNYQESYTTKAKKVAHSVQYEFLKLNPKLLYNRVVGKHQVRKPSVLKISSPAKSLRMAKNEAKVAMQNLQNLNQKSLPDKNLPAKKIPAKKVPLSTKQKAPATK